MAHKLHLSSYFFCTFVVLIQWNLSTNSLEVSDQSWTQEKRLHNGEKYIPDSPLTNESFHRHIASISTYTGINRSSPYSFGDYDEDAVFRAFWDVPNYCGKHHGIVLPLAEFGIEFNSDHNWHFGDIVNAFGWYQLGYYPFITRRNHFVNGGLPQLANLTAHLNKATADILAAIPNAEFNGIGMIDWEGWQPQWSSEELNIESRYKVASENHVRQLHPDWNASTVEQVAKQQWTEGARNFMESTLKLAKRLRPKAVWGYYHYPYCNAAEKQTACEHGQEAKNDEIMWLFDEETVIYPSIYLKKGEATVEAVETRLAEAFRVRDKSTDPKKVVLSYTRFNYSHVDFYLTLEDLNNTVLKSAEFGTHGIVFWGDNNDDKTKATCQELQAYVRDALGPAVKLAREGAIACSQRVCSGHGRCVGKLFDCEKVDGYGTKNATCSCRCFRGWGGIDCNTAE